MQIRRMAPTGRSPARQGPHGLQNGFGTESGGGPTDQIPISCAPCGPGRIRFLDRPEYVFSRIPHIPVPGQAGGAPSQTLGVRDEREIQRVLLSRALTWALCARGGLRD